MHGLDMVPQPPTTDRVSAEFDNVALLKEDKRDEEKSIKQAITVGTSRVKVFLGVLALVQTVQVQL